uniref:Uncharacterized protein n=1 Tax=Pseudo-nitzschia australis TaxID=44445 RepID=A0A7S4AFK3_9STRA
MVAWPSTHSQTYATNKKASGDTYSTSTGASNVSNQNGWRLSDQDRAMEHLRIALNAWSSKRRQWEAHQYQYTHQHQHQPSSSSSSNGYRVPDLLPLVIYASGGKGVGKRSLARSILGQLHQKDGDGYGDDTSSSRGQPRTQSNTETTALDGCELAWREGAATVAEDAFSKEGSHQYSASSTTSASHYCPLLHLTPSDYYRSQGVGEEYDYNYDLDYDETTESGVGNDGGSSSRLYRTILDHVVAAGGGASIVVLDRVDCSRAPLVPAGHSTAGTTSALGDGACGETGSSTIGGDAYGASHGSWLPELMKKIVSRPAVFGNTIILMTSRVGTATAEKWTRKRLQSATMATATVGDLQQTKARSVVAVDEVESLLRYEIRRNHHRHYDKYGGDVAAGDDIGIDEWLVVPMAPLDRNAMGAVLGRIAAIDAGNDHNALGLGSKRDEGQPLREASDTRNSNSNKNTHKHNRMVAARPVTLTESAANRILDAMEWHQWIHKNTGEVLRVWSPDGAFPLLRFWKERVLPPITNRSECRLVAGVDVDVDVDVAATNEGNIKLVLDFEEGTTEQFVVRSCLEVDGGSSTNHNGIITTTTMDGKSWNCWDGSEAKGKSCRFYL